MFWNIFDLWEVPGWIFLFFKHPRLSFSFLDKKDNLAGRSSNWSHLALISSFQDLIRPFRRLLSKHYSPSKKIRVKMYQFQRNDFFFRKQNMSVLLLFLRFHPAVKRCVLLNWVQYLMFERAKKKKRVTGISDGMEAGV